MKQSRIKYLEILETFLSIKKKISKSVRIVNLWSNNYIEYESNYDRNKTLSGETYINKIRPYLKDIIKNLKKSDTWKIQLTMSISLISSKNYNEVCVMHSKSDNIEIMIDNKADEVIEKLFELRCDSPDQIKNKKATINPINKKDNNCF